MYGISIDETMYVLTYDSVSGWRAYGVIGVFFSDSAIYKNLQPSISRLSLSPTHRTVFPLHHHHYPPPFSPSNMPGPGAQAALAPGHFLFTSESVGEGHPGMSLYGFLSLCIGES